MKREFRYFTAAETQKEGYLRRRFAEIRRRLAEQDAAQKAANVTRLKKREAVRG
jgi:hypothetical protein